MTATLAGTVALVTGASSGIGAATARALAGQDAAVALLARRADRLHELVAEIEAAGGTALAVPADVTDADQVASAVAAVVGELGRLDILVNNAGLMRTGDAADAPLKDWDDLVAVNIQGVLYATRASLPHLITAAADSPRGVADVVTVSSTAGRVARPNTAVYSLTKFGVNAFSEGIRQELIASASASASSDRALWRPRSPTTSRRRRGKPSTSALRAWSSCSRRTSLKPSSTWSPGTAGSRSTRC